MSENKIVRKEAVNIEKEEKWLLLEIQFLNYFKEDVQEILALQEKVSALKQLAESGKASEIQKKLSTLMALIEKDEDKFKRFRRVLNRGERRRVRYENRVLGNLAEISSSLDQPKKKELEGLVEQIHVYSARVLTELSWQVGKITVLTSKKVPDISLIKQHLNVTIEASTALVALMQRLESLVQSVENKIHEKKLIQTIHPQVAGLTGYLREGVIKTAVIKSVVPLRYFLEKGLAKKIKKMINVISDKYVYNEPGKKFMKIIENYTPELSKVLSSNDIEQLKDINYEVPPEATLLFLPGFRKPILAYNIHLLPDFSSRGWVSHAIPGENLEKVSKNGILTAPLEMVFEKKQYFTEKDTDVPRRLTDGISFSFQEYEKYQAYQRNTKRTSIVGGMFLFPLKPLLQPGLIFDFAKTMDGYPEITLKDEAYLDNRADIISEILYSLNSYSEWINNYDDTNVFFNECKKNLDFLERMEKSLNGNEVMNFKLAGKEVFFAKDFRMLDMLKVHQLVSQSLGEEFIARLNRTHQTDRNGKEYNSLAEQYNSEEWKHQHEFFRSQAVLTGKGYFYERLSQIYLKKDYLQDLIKYIRENNFFQFSLLVVGPNVKIPPNEEAFIPPLARFGKEQAPTFFDGTIFQQGFDYFNYRALKFSSYFSSACLALTFMKEKHKLFSGRSSYSLQDYLDLMKKISPRETRKLFAHAQGELIIALKLIIEGVFRTRKTIPCIVETKKGVLLINPANKDEVSIRRLAKLGVPIFSQLGIRNDFDFIREEMDFIVRNIIQPIDLPGGESYYDQGGYFYQKEDKIIAHLRKSNRKMIISK